MYTYAYKCAEKYEALTTIELRSFGSSGDKPPQDKTYARSSKLCAKVP